MQIAKRFNKAMFRTLDNYIQMIFECIICFHYIDIVAAPWFNIIILFKDIFDRFFLTSKIHSTNAEPSQSSTLKNCYKCRQFFEEQAPTFLEDIQTFGWENNTGGGVVRERLIPESQKAGILGILDTEEHLQKCKD